MPSTYASSQLLPTELRSIKPRFSTSPTNSNFTSLKSPGFGEFIPPSVPSQSVTEPTVRNRGGPVSVYHSISWILGFREKYSLLWFFIFGGGLLGFCLARSMTLNPKLIEAQTTPGEFFWLGRPKFKINYIIHIYLTIVGGWMVGLQFLPGIRRRFVLLHRINGYFVLFCLLPGNITGAIAGAKSFGGEVNAVTAYYFLAFAIVFCGLVGIWNVKRQTRQHRKWMLRMVAYFAVPITSRVIMLTARAIISHIGTYYSVWRCDEMMYLMKDLSVAQTLYPQCFGGVDPSKISIAVHASLNEGKVNVASAVRVTIGMALWLGTVIHALGVEIYIRLTEDMNQNRYGYVLEPRDSDGHGEALWNYGR